MKRKLFVSCVLALLVCLAAGGYFYVTSPQEPEAGQAAKASGAAAEKERQTPKAPKADDADGSGSVVDAPEDDPWQVAWLSQRQALQDLKTEAVRLRKTLPGEARKLQKTSSQLSKDVNRLLMLSTTYKDNPRVLEAVSKRIAAVGVSLQEAMSPLLTLSDNIKDVTAKVGILEKIIPAEARKGLDDVTLKDTEDALQTQKQLTETQSRLTALLSQPKTMLEKIQKAHTTIEAYLPILWQKTYLAPPERYLYLDAWTGMDEALLETFQNFSMRLPMEFPQTLEAWMLAGTTFCVTLFIGALGIFLLHRRIRQKNSGEAWMHLFQTSLPALCVGIAVMLASFSIEGGIYRSIMLLGNAILLLGQTALAWDLRRINQEELPQRSPLWPPTLLALLGFLLTYPGLPAPLMNVIWIVILGAAIFLQRRRKTPEHMLSYEGVILQLEPAILLICFLLSVFGLYRYAVLIYMFFISLAVAIQLSLAGLHILHSLADKLPESGIGAVLGSIGIACAAPAALIIIVLGMGQWLLNLPGGVYLMRHYADWNFTVGETRFSPIQLLLIISMFYITRTAVSMGTSFLRTLPNRGMHLDTSLLPPLITAFTYGIWCLYGLFVLKSLGMELSNLAMVAGGLSVGIGFGMQNIVNNFLSGLILIFSRIMQEGDVVEVGGLTGTVRKISIRATTVETYDNAMIFVPNAEFVSNRLINWTRNSRMVRRTLSIGVAYGTDPQMVIKLLQSVANASPDVLRYPQPSVLFTEFADSTLNFSLRFWINDVDKEALVSSALRVEIERVFREQNVEIAFPQMDIHIKDMPGTARTPETRASAATPPGPAAEEGMDREDMRAD